MDKVHNPPGFDIAAHDVFLLLKELILYMFPVNWVPVLKEIMKIGHVAKFQFLKFVVFVVFLPNVEKIEVISKDFIYEFKIPKERYTFHENSIYNFF